jgi:dienelactone hydrolase
MSKVIWLVLILVEIVALVLLICKKSKGAGKKILKVLGILVLIPVILLTAIPAFVIKDYKGRPTTGEYGVAQSEAILVDSSRVESFETDGSYREVPVHFYYPEEIMSVEENSLPLVIFSHGAFGYYESNTSTYMELASNGYVVVSLDHPYHSFYTKDTTGKTITVDPEFMNTAMNVGNSDISETEVYAITSQWMELREADMNFVLDTLIDTANSGNFGDEWFFVGSEKDEIAEALKCTDTDKIGLMGHSLGGATAVTVGRRADVSAVIDFDGTMIGEEIGVDGDKILVNEDAYTTPLLCLDSESHHADREMAREQGVVYANNVILDNATDGHCTYIVGAKHMDFTDLPLFAPALANMLGSGDVNNEECIDQINQITLNFFNCYLKGNGDFTVNDKY